MSGGGDGGDALLVIRLIHLFGWSRIMLTRAGYHTARLLVPSTCYRQHESEVRTDRNEITKT